MLIILSIAIAAAGASIFAVYEFQQLDSALYTLSELRNDNQAKGERLTQLNNQISALNAEAAKLEKENNEFADYVKYLQEENDKINSDNQNLKNNYESLQEDYRSLASENSELKYGQAYFELLANEEKTRRESAVSEPETSAIPPYTIIQGREIYWGFKDSKGNFYDWSMPIDTYRALIEYPEPEDMLSLQTDDGDIFYVRDHTKFVESSSFKEVIDDVYRNTGGNDYQFLYEAWYITSQLTTYSADIEEDPRWALETLTEAGGDCEDLTILIASMLKASKYTQDWTIQMVFFDSDNPEDPKDVNHVALYVSNGDFGVFVESTAKNEGLSVWNERVNGWYYDV